MNLSLTASKRHLGHTLQLSTYFYLHFSSPYFYLPHTSPHQASESPNYQLALYPHTIKMLSELFLQMPIIFESLWLTQLESLSLAWSLAGANDSREALSVHLMEAEGISV